MTASGPTNRQILLVEDELIIAMTLEAALVAAGYKVVGPFAKLKGAMEAARDAMLDAAVLDVNLGRSTAYPIAEILCARKIPFLFLTGYALTEIIEAYRQYPILAKPFDTAEMVVQLDKLFAEAGVSRY